MSRIIVAVSAVVAIGLVAYFTAEANIEESKALAFVGKACVDAGGEWQQTWNNKHNCIRQH